jgi:hypothetical protein
MDLLIDVYSENMCAEMVEVALNYWKMILRISTQTYLEFYRFRPSIIRNELMNKFKPIDSNPRNYIISIRYNFLRGIR